MDAEPSAGDPTGEPPSMWGLAAAPGGRRRSGTNAAAPHAARVAAGILLSPLAGFAREAISG